MIAERGLEIRPAHNAVRSHGSTNRSRDIRVGEAEHIRKAQGLVATAEDWSKSIA
jgi:hypothetical protein